MSRTPFVVAACAALGVASGCKARANEAAPVASAVAAAAPAASAAPVARAKPWFSGAFSGAYDAKLAAVEIKVGAVREWAKDDGKSSSGPGKLSLQIDDDGYVTGTSEGALGASSAGGKVDDDVLRVQLSPSDQTGLRGVLVAKRDGDGFKGSIQASSGDSLRVREATFELKKQAN